MKKSVDSIKILVIGDHPVGKTSMIISLVNNSFPDEYCPKCFDFFSHKCVVDGDHDVIFGLCDTAGNTGEENKHRISHYPDCDLIVLCFSITMKSSLLSVTTRWYPEIQENAPEIPVLLVGLKLDLREDSETIKELDQRNEKMVPRGDGERVYRQLKLAGYHECSSKMCNLKEIEQVMWDTFKKSGKRKKSNNGREKNEKCFLM